ncbi:right-handed parallel beta-helix repeat-containing protein [Pseudonocardia sp.]|uniref:right-handed parallel beta-helix repeat-containing protein n=1 Tax=Pseudonocardia sp. TaxID=60912 RepID=UPI003D13A6BD
MRYRRCVVALAVTAAAATAACSAQPPVAPTYAVPAPTGDAVLHVAPDGDDEGPGTEREPLATISAAAERARPGTTVLVGDGTYEGDVRTAADGTPDARIAFVAQSPAASIRTDGNATGGWENDGDYVDIVGFTLTGDNEDGIFNRGSHVRIMNNRVSQFPGNCIYTANDDYDLTDIDVIGNIASDCGESNLDHAIYVTHQGGVIANNLAYGAPGFGIHCWHACNRITIVNNVVFDNGEGGIVIGGANDDDVPVEDSLVANNIVVANAREGIREGGDSGSGNRFLNNLLWDNERDQILLRDGEEAGTIVADPQFVDYRADGAGDYRLLPSSPAVGRGTSEMAPPVAIDGTPRPTGAVDLGAYQL